MVAAGFIPNSTGHVSGVTYSLWTGVEVKGGSSQGYTHTVYDIEMKVANGTVIGY